MSAFKRVAKAEDAVKLMVASSPKLSAPPSDESSVSGSITVISPTAQALGKWSRTISFGGNHSREVVALQSVEKHPEWQAYLARASYKDDDVPESLLNFALSHLELEEVTPELRQILIAKLAKRKRTTTDNVCRSENKAKLAEVHSTCIPFNNCACRPANLPWTRSR